MCMEVYEMILTGENKELGENPAQYNNVHHK
jgi:hypothetical protein